jgi:ASCH domain-containing protein
VTYALTIRQPWAAMIMTGEKAVEYRSWATSYRGTLFIHAGLALDRDAPQWEGPPLVFGAVLGHVILFRITGTEGAWEWHLRAPRPFTEPVPCPGRLGLWKWKR